MTPVRRSARFAAALCPLCLLAACASGETAAAGDAAPDAGDVALADGARDTRRDDAALDTGADAIYDLGDAPRACVTAAECGATLACIAGGCAPCAKDEECAVGERCDAGACKPVCTRSLQSILDGAPATGAVTVPACVHRESVVIDKPLLIVARPGAELRGSDVWTDWTRSGTTWVSSASVPELITVRDAARCVAGTRGRCLRAEQVFVDGKPLDYAIGVAPGSGQFTLDATRAVVLGDDPTGHLVEVTTRPRWVTTASDGVTLRGLTLRHCGNDALTGGISNDGFIRFTLDGCTLSDAHGAVIALRVGSKLRLHANDVARGGATGILLENPGDGTIVDANAIHGCGADGFDPGFGAGGVDVSRAHALVLQGNEVRDGVGFGIRVGVGSSEVTVSGNRVHDNTRAGVVFEVGNGATIDSNAVWENGWARPNGGLGAGILVSSAAKADVHDNVVAWNAAGIVVLSQQRADAPGIGTIGDAVHDNVVVGVDGHYALAWLQDWAGVLFDPTSKNLGKGNAFWLDVAENGKPRFAWMGDFPTLVDFAGTRGGGAGTHYLTDAEQQAALTAKAVPTTAKAR